MRIYEAYARLPLSDYLLSLSFFFFFTIHGLRGMFWSLLVLFGVGGTLGSLAAVGWPHSSSPFGRRGAYFFEAF